MKSKLSAKWVSRAAGLACLVLAATGWCAGASAAEKKAVEKHWYKGNIHCHTLWSDGNSFPEWVADWYRSHGFNFVALTDHNVFQEGEKWVKLAPKKGKGTVSQEAYDKYQEKFGSGLDEKTSAGQKLIRLKRFRELSPKFNAPGKFLVIPGEELTTNGPKGTNYRVHAVTINITHGMTEPTAKEGQKNAGTWLANTMARQVAAHRKEANQPVHGHLNHPLWSHMTLEDVLAVRGFNQMEINNEEPQDLPKIEKIWDAVIADRIKNGKPPMLGLAVDDAHNHLTPTGEPSTEAGNGWIVVRAESLTPENIVKAIDEGNFYASSGPELTDIRRRKDNLSLKIKPEEGLTYKTEFIGQRKGGEPGAVLATSSDLKPSYEIQGTELYVRAKVTSSKAFKNAKGEVAFYATAWTQPYQPMKMK